MNKIKSNIFWLLYRPISFFKTFRFWYKNIYRVHNKSEIVVKLPLLTKLKYNLIGFTDLQYVLFNLKNNNYRDFISTWERLRLEKVNDRFAFFLGEKVMFERLFGKYVNVPHIHCWVKCGKFINLDDNETEISIIKEIQKEGAFIAKPSRSLGGGKKIHELFYANQSYYIDGKEFLAEDFEKECRKLEDYIFTKKISSHEYSKKIYPFSSNTIRVITTMDNKTNDVDVLLAFHRFGTKRSKFVDNISSGGVFALVDIETGIIGEAKSIFDLNDLDRTYSTHPDTGAPIKDAYIPKWQELLATIKHAHKCFAYYRFFAWDITLDENGKLWVLEINRGSDLSVQVLSPLRHAKLGDWMNKQGLLRSYK